MKSYNGFTGEERLKGQRIINRAIKDGVLPPLEETRCALCGQDKGARYYHCEDYSPNNILKDATPVCWRCHRKIHTENKDTYEYKHYWSKVKEGHIFDPVYISTYWPKERDKDYSESTKQTKLV